MTSPALILSFPTTTSAADRDRLVALLAEFDLLAIHEDDPARPSRWTAHFPTAHARDLAADSVRADAGYDGVRLERVEIEDEDWARRTQADLPAIRIGRIVVAPPWDIPGGARGSGLGTRGSGLGTRGSGLGTRDSGFGARDSGPGARDPVVVVIEPSRGFGTGHHQSTRLCLALLQARDLAGRTMIDAGTGSGVLAIAAARLGAAFVSAIDVDPDAIDNARENIERNGVASTVEAHVGDLARATLQPADVVTANLTGSILARHATELASLVKPGGVLIASGFTLDEQERVVAAFADRLSVVETADEEGWAGVVFA